MRRATILVLVGALLLAMTAGVAVAKDIKGTNGNDIIAGTNQADKINALAGNDKVRGLKGADVINGGFGADTLQGNRGADTLRGAPGQDTVIGNRGDDLVRGGVGRDVLEGRGDNDRLIAAGDGQRDLVDCGFGNDDFAKVDLNDVVDGQPVEDLLVEAAGQVGAVVSCETIVVNLTGGLSVTVELGVLSQDEIDLLVDEGIITL